MHDVVVLNLAQPKQKHNLAVAQVALKAARAVSHVEGDKRYTLIYIERIYRLSTLRLLSAYHVCRQQGRGRVLMYLI